MEEKVRYCVKNCENDTGKYFKDYNIAYNFCLKNKALLFKTDENGEVLIIDMREI